MSSSDVIVESSGDNNNDNNGDNNNGDNDMSTPQQPKKGRNLRPKIAILPKAVVDQIAAGEVVQRPVSVVKELLENSLDAGATQIIVQFDGLSKLSIIDNGKGIPKKDLHLLCTRHATSKLRSVDDFSTLGTFGFRGEALASTSMVSRLLTVVSRVRIGDYDDDDENCGDTRNEGSLAFSQSYKMGKPMKAQPKPCARKIGTTITIEDLFYNVPHRQKAYSKKDSEEYAKIHKVVQDYSLHYPTVGFVCQRKVASGRSKKTQLVVDCNTGQLPAVKALLQSARASKTSTAQDNNTHEQIKEATKQILSQILESNLANHLLYMECGISKTDSKSTNDGQCEPRNNTAIEDSPMYKFQYSAQVYFTSPAYHNSIGSKNGSKAKQGKFVLFLNHRLVDLPPLKRSLEEIYADLGNPNRNKGASNSNLGKPVLLVNLTVPGCQVDVNVHPSKKQVALMHQEDLIRNISEKLQERLEEDGQAFVAQSVQTKPKSILKNPYAKKRKRPADEEEHENEHDEGDNHCGAEGETDTEPSPSKKVLHGESLAQTPDTKPKPKTSSSSSTAKKVAPSKLVRTNSAARAGAIEPFLVPTQTQQSQSLSQNSESSDSVSNQSRSKRPLLSEQQQQQLAVLHVSTCPLSKPAPPVDMSQPGAFAEQLKRERCTCPTEPARRTVLIPNTVTRPKKVVPTASKYTSVAQLRKRIGKQQCFDTTSMIRKAFFMGTMSHQRSLIQCDEELVMINHFELAKEMFYQLALARFGGGAQLAQLGSMAGNGGIHIQTVVSQALQYEDDLALQREKERESASVRESSDTMSLSNTLEVKEVNESNRNLAQHVTACLVERAPMLDEYFSIRIECPNQHENGNTIDDISSGAILTGLPILLEGHCPQPHALPIFLLRLATQVDWTREKHCFHGICKELGNFYAMLPNESPQGGRAGGGELNSYVRHHLFPALSYLLLPSKNLPKNGHFTKMTKLSTLYKVFERC